MGKKRRRSETGDSECDDSAAEPVRKKSHREKWSIPEELYRRTELSHKLYDFLRKYKDADNRCLCDFLIRAPSRRLQPEYYEVIHSPIDLLKIQQRLKTDEYRSVPSFISDVQLLLENAKKFYKKGSEELQNAEELERAFLERLQECWEEASEGPSRVKSPTPLTLRIPKDQLLSTKRSPPPSSTPTEAGKQHKAKAVTPTSSELSVPSHAGSKSGSSRRAALHVKVTRSKAWLAEYAQSTDPVKIYLAAVYDYHSVSGEFVSEVFHELPSPKDYPEYYRIITEPIDLNMIKKNIEDGKYDNLKEIQDDMLLLIKNAHYFNEPGSEIYKLASTLRKFVINRCAELERKFQTVPKSMPLKVSLKRPVGGASVSQTPSTSSAEGEQKKVPKLKLKFSAEDVRGQRSSHSSLESEETESDSSDESSSDAEEEEEEEGKERGKLLLQVKKEVLAAGHSGGDPVAKLLKAKRPPPLKKQLMAIYHTLVTKTDENGRLLCDLFMRRPSPKVYPEYYLVIKEPIDFREILHRIRTMQYSSMEDFMASVDLMVDNACTFNEEDSQVYNDALTLQKTAKDANKRLQQGWSSTPPPAPPTKPTPRGRPRGRTGSTSTQVGGTPGAVQAVGGAQTSPVEALLTTVKNCTASNGRHVWLSFKQLPPQLLVDLSAVRKPVDMTTIQSKVQTNQYASAEQLFEDLNLLFDSTCLAYPRESLLYKDAIVLHRAAVKKYLQLTAAEREKRKVPDVQKCVQTLLREIVTRTTNFQDVSGRKPADSLQKIIAAQELPSNGEGTPAKRTFTLSRVEQWVTGDHYSRLDHLQSDLLALFRQARQAGGGRESQMYQDSVATQRQYISVRDSVCQNGQLLWSPALDYTHQVLEAELSSEALQTTASPQPPASPRSELGERDSTPISVVDSSTSKQHSPTPTVILPDESSREYFQETEYEGTSYRVGDIVYVTARKPDQQSHIVLIEKLWKDGSGSFWLDGCWFYRPEETYHLATKKFYEKEVFKSDFHGLAQLSNVHGRCHIMFIRDYPKYKPEGFSEEDVFVCESRYSFKARNFKKIKVWNFIPGPQPKLVPRDSPLVLKRVPSVFVSKQLPESKEVEPESDQAEDGMETVEEEEASMDVDVGNTSADVLEMSFCESLRNVQATVPNPEAGCTYYEQYCIDDDRFQLGDFVYVRSDQDRPFIARINKMWSDANDDPWFHGPWFVWPDEVTHPPTRMFYEYELFMSNIQDTNPMRSIIGKCAVLFITDYLRKRPTEFAEVDVFVAECRYNESDKVIRKMKGLKQFQLSSSTTAGEVYFFSEEIQPLKVPSPNVSSDQGMASDSVPPSSKEPSGSSTPVSTPSAPPSTSAPLPTPSTLPVNPPAGQNVVRNLLNMSPHLLQALLSSASQLSSTRPVIIPLQQTPLNTTPTLNTAPTVSTTSNTISSLHTVPSLNTIPSTGLSSTPSRPTTAPNKASTSASVGYMCRWEGCGQVFETTSDITTHVLYSSQHLKKEGENNYYCRWGLCPRNPKFGGKPLDTMPKLTRHMREVHLMKLTQGALGLTSRGSHSTPHLQPSTPSPSISVTPSPPATHQLLTNTPLTAALQVLPPSVIVSALADSRATAEAGTDKPATPGDAPTATVPNIFLPPPEDRRKLVHSDIYLKYIQGLQSGSKYMSNCESSEKIRATQQPRPPRPEQASDWLAPGAVQPSASVEDALWVLRDHLLRDSMKLAGYLKENS